VSVLRTMAGLTEARADYTAAMQTADYGAATATIRVRIYQLGSLGRG